MEKKDKETEDPSYPFESRNIIVCETNGQQLNRFSSHVDLMSENECRAREKRRKRDTEGRGTKRQVGLLKGRSLCKGWSLIYIRK